MASAFQAPAPIVAVRPCAVAVAWVKVTVPNFVVEVGPVGIAVRIGADLLDLGRRLERSAEAVPERGGCRPGLLREQSEAGTVHVADTPLNDRPVAT
jgi:hypothetical protein